MLDHSTTCVCAQCQADRLRQKAARGHVNPLNRIERDRLPPVPTGEGQLVSAIDALIAWEEVQHG